MKTRPRKQRHGKMSRLESALRCEERSANALSRANELSEKGQKEAAESFYERSAHWLMRANELRGY